MKKYITCFLILAVFMIAGCKKNDGPIPRSISVTRVPEPLVTKNGGSLSIDLTNLGAFQGKFNVGLFFPDDVPPSKMDIVVRKNSNNGNVKVIQAGVTTYPSSFTVTAAQLASLFAAPVTVGDDYDISADVYTKAGEKFEAFPPVGTGYGANIGAPPGASPVIRYSAICAFNPAIYQGNFKILVDEWADYNVGDVVTLTPIDATHFSFKYLPAGPLPIVVTVNPLTNETSVPKQVYGTLGYPPGWPYGPISCASVPSPLNLVAPCDQSFGVKLDHTVAAGSFGTYYIQMKKL